MADMKVADIGCSGRRLHGTKQIGHWSLIRVLYWPARSIMVVCEKKPCEGMRAVPFLRISRRSGYRSKVSLRVRTSSAVTNRYR